jgi:large subunit ribosomal protein L54
MAPTPESAAFLAKKPTVPPTFDGVDYDDTNRLKQAQDAIIREQWVKSMMARLVREELGKCYYREGVNHLEKCGALRGQLWHQSLPTAMWQSHHSLAAT